MAMACLRLLTLRPDRPLRSVPRLRSCIARRTVLLAALLYLRATFVPLAREPVLAVPTLAPAPDQGL